MRLEVTRKNDLAVQALLELSGATARMKAPEIAANVGSTAGFVAQVLTPLVRSGWVRSDPGPKGGYSLQADISKLSVLSVIEAIEGPTDSGRCVVADRPCADGGMCALHGPWLQARTQLLAELASVTVASVPSRGGDIESFVIAPAVRGPVVDESLVGNAELKGSAP